MTDKNIEEIKKEIVKNKTLKPHEKIALLLQLEGKRTKTIKSDDIFKPTTVKVRDPVLQRKAHQWVNELLHRYEWYCRNGWYYLTCKDCNETKSFASVAKMRKYIIVHESEHNHRVPQELVNYGGLYDVLTYHIWNTMKKNKV